MTRPARAALALAAALVASACGASGARLHLSVPTALRADRVVVSGFVDDEPVFEALEFPETPRPLDEEEDLVVLVDDALAGEDVVLTLVVKEGDRDRANASADFDVEVGVVVDVDVEFGR